VVATEEKPKRVQTSLSPQIVDQNRKSDLSNYFAQKSSFPKLFLGGFSILTFILLLFLYLFTKVFNFLLMSKLTPLYFRSKIQTTFMQRIISLMHFFDRNRQGTVSRVYLIELAIRNMKVKKTRSIITIGGMSIGVGAIVFLVSIGYGLQELVVSRVARLDEMKQADVTLQTGSNVKINDKTLSDFKRMPNVKYVLPLIAVVGRVNYQNSISDMAVYGVTAEYLRQSAIKPSVGKIYESNKLSQAVGKSSRKVSRGEVAGISTQATEVKTGEEIGPVDFSIDPGTWVRVRRDATTDAQILGYTKRTEGVQQGIELYGESYDTDASSSAQNTEEIKEKGRWIRSSVLLWKKEKCDIEKADCEKGQYLINRDESGSQGQKEGYFAELNITIENTKTKSSSVLGITSDSDVLANETENLDWVEIASESAASKTIATKKTKLAANAEREAVVNRAMLKILGIKEAEAVGKTFSTSFVINSDLAANTESKIESSPAEYKIVGIIPDDKTPIFYVPFTDLRSLGVVNFSQVKVVMDSQEALPLARTQIETMGFVTTSVADTVSQINSLFATARTILALLGMVALAVAALGMFNTLTVSLLERTREVGLMKAMGMKSSEVKELFLTESMVMGFFGGVLGIIIGFVAGKLLGLLLSIFAIFKGVGYIDIAYIPPPFIAVVLALSLFVGIVTGIYPARRATKISALNALRYE